ncbi:hypothetical protein [Burkholderia vietnamiensis]|uniref:hypothetical protein n=1 Tax=Burkholderia vietnamiensis TaxID=60552 RepID=UPI0034554420
MEKLNELLYEYAKSIRRDDETAFIHADAIREYFRARPPCAASANETGAEVTRPSGYAYRYRSLGGSVIRFNGGGEVNGSRPIEAIPYWFAAPQPAQADARSEDAYVAKRLSEVLASVYATLIGDDEADADESLNAIERVERAAKVLRLEVELYRGQADARVGLTAEQREAIEYAVTWLDENVSNRYAYTAAKELRALLATRPGQPEPRAEVTDEPSLTNPLTPYGMLVRALRIVSGTTLMDMAEHLGRGPAELSAIEFGRKPVRDADIDSYLTEALTLEFVRDVLKAARRTTTDREAIIEECARVCDEHAKTSYLTEAVTCARKIRALKTAAPSHPATP